jgi:lipoate-protein ligase A
VTTETRPAAAGGLPATGSWSLVTDIARPGWENMAIDSALLDLADAGGSAFLRLYRWNPHCLSFGRNEPARRRYDTERIGALGLDCVRRPTGGRAVWHARELTYAVAAPLAAFGGLRQAYEALHRLLATALATLGVSPRLAPRASPVGGVGTGPCFAAPVGGEVLIEGRKVVGSAQLRQGDAFLQHGSLLLDDDQSLVRDLAGFSENGAAEAPLSRLVGRTVRFEEVAEAIAAIARATLPNLEETTRLPDAVRTGVSRHAERFRSADWTWQR